MKKNMLTNQIANLYQPPAPVQGAVNAAGISTSGGSPFGARPDLSGLTPQQMASITEGLNNLTYSVPTGGYLTRDEASNANSWYNKFGAGTGGDPLANREAANIYGLIGEQPTVPNMTAALSNLYSMTGQKPAQGPSFNERMTTAGLPGTFQGPFEFKGYHPFDALKKQYGLI